MEQKSNFRSQNPDLDWLKGMQPKITSVDMTQIMIVGIQLYSSQPGWF